MSITSVQGETTTDNFSLISEEIASRLLQGWTLLESVCSICHETPLLKQRNAPDKYCARCNVFLKRENAEEMISSTPDLVNEKEKENNTISQNGNEKDTKKEEVKYIKEIKLQNGEFDDFLSKSTTPQFETDSLMNISKYINDKCGNYFTDYLPHENKGQHITEKDKETKEEETEKEKGIIMKRETERNVKEKEKTEEVTDKKQKVIEAKIETTDNDFPVRSFYCEKKVVSNHRELKNESFVFAKVKYALMNVLEKYAELLPHNNRNEEVELITKMTQVTILLEKINNLSKTLTI